MEGPKSQRFWRSRAFHFALASLIVIVGVHGAYAESASTDWKYNSTFGFCLAQQLKGDDYGIRIVRTPASDDTQIVLFDTEKWGDRPSVNLEGASVTIGQGGIYSSVARVGWAKSPSTRFASVLVTDPAFLQHFAASSTVSVSHPKLAAMSVLFQSSALAAEELRKCENDKMSGWGIDPQAWHALRSPPQPLGDYRSWILPESSSLSGTVDGQAVLRLTITPDGRVKDCEGIDRSIADELNRAACTGLSRRGHFNPAYDAEGKPVQSPYIIVAEFSRRPS